MSTGEQHVLLIVKPSLWAPIKHIFLLFYFMYIDCTQRPEVSDCPGAGCELPDMSAGSQSQVLR